MNTRIGRMLFAVIGLFLFCALAMQAHAATITVTNANDSGPGSLRQALANANNGDRINFAVTGAITLTSDGLVVDKNVTISGPGANQLSIVGIPRVSVFLCGDAIATISGLTIRNGAEGIDNSGILTVSNCVITGNSVGIYNGTASLTVVNSNVSDNTIQGIINNAGELGVVTATILSTTVSGNPWGGVFIGTDPLGGRANVTITDCTISGNSFDGGIFAGGGGFGTLLTVANSTISGNSSGTGGGGIWVNANSSLRISNTILNAGASGPNIFNDGGTVTSNGYNLSSDDGGGYLNGPGDQINTDPLLGPLQDNGGPTETHALLLGSPAIDQGNSRGVSVDQRHFHRPIDIPDIPNAIGGDGSDIGAFEFGSYLPRADFNLDGFTDYLLFNTGNRATAIWYLHDNTYLSSGYGPPVPNGWTVVDAADFNGDGNPDYALFNPSTRQTAIWYMNNNVHVSGAFGPTLPGGWQLVAVGDFNVDGKPDYVLYNTGTRQTAIWYLNNNIRVSGAYGPTIASGYALSGVADFNSDGKPDYAIYNATTRQTAIWYLNNNIYVSAAYGPTIASGYVVSGVADFNSDAKPDYVLYRTGTRQTAIWYLNNNIYLRAALAPTLPVGWNLVVP